MTHVLLKINAHVPRGPSSKAHNQVQWQHLLRLLLNNILYCLCLSDHFSLVYFCKPSFVGWTNPPFPILHRLIWTRPNKLVTLNIRISPIMYWQNNLGLAIAINQDNVHPQMDTHTFPSLSNIHTYIHAHTLLTPSLSPHAHPMSLSPTPSTQTSSSHLISPHMLTPPLSLVHTPLPTDQTTLSSLDAHKAIKHQTYLKTNMIMW